MTHLTALETACDVACKAQKIAQARYDRSRSKANTLALIEARDAFTAALDAFIPARDAAELAARKARRAANIAAAAERRAAQPDLF